MAPLTRAAATRQAANNGGSETSQEATVPAVVRRGAQRGANANRNNHVVQDGNSANAINEDAAGGVVNKRIFATIKDSEANKASQQNISKEGTEKSSRPAAKPRKAACPSQKRGNRATTRRGAARPPLGGSHAETSGSKEAANKRKRGREEPHDPTTGRAPCSPESTRRNVRRKVAKAPPASLTNPNSSVRSIKDGSSKQEENPSDEQDDDNRPRFTRIEKGKFTEREGIAASALIELSLAERLFSAKQIVQPCKEAVVVAVKNTTETDK